MCPTASLSSSQFCYGLARRFTPLRFVLEKATLFPFTFKNSCRMFSQTAVEALRKTLLYPELAVLMLGHEGAGGECPVFCAP